MAKSRRRGGQRNSGSRADRDIGRMQSRSPGPHQPTPPVHRGGGTSSPSIDTGGTAGGPGPEAGSGATHPPHGSWRPGTRGMLIAGAAGLGVGGLMIAAHRRRTGQVKKIYDPVTDSVYEIEKAAHSGTTGKAPGQFAHHEHNLYGAPQGAGGRGRGSAHVLEAAGRHSTGRRRATVLGTHPGTLVRRGRPLTPAGSHVTSENKLKVVTRRSPRGGSQTALAMYHSGDQNKDTGGGKFYGSRAGHVRKSVGFQAEGAAELGFRGTPFAAFNQQSRVGHRLPA